MPLAIFAGTSYVPDLYMILVFCFSNTSPNTLYNSDKALSGLKKNQIKNPRDINTQLVAPRTILKFGGHIASLAINELMELAIFDLQRFKKLI